MARPADEVYDALKSDIQTGVLAPGAHLVEENLCTQYGVSRTPVRTALRRLSDDGLVSVEPRRGAFVASWTSDDAAEVMAIRAMLEPYAAGLAAQHRSPEDLAVLCELCHVMDDTERRRPANFREILAQRNHELHLTILRSAASPRLYGIAANLAQAPLMNGSFQLYGDHQLRRSLGEHRELAAAIEAQDAQAARAVMEAHLRLAYRALAGPRKGVSNVGGVLCQPGPLSAN